MSASPSPYFAAIDLGSNSFHMLVVRSQNGNIEIVDREKEMVQIARGLSPGAELAEDAQQRALECLARFSERLRDIPSSQMRAVGTKALRAAKSAKRFLRKAERALGAPIQIVSGYEEARLVYKGLSNTVVDETRQRLVADIGGGSTEFVIGRGHAAKRLESLPLGCVIYTEIERLSPGNVTAKRMRAAYLSACRELEEIRPNYLRTGWDIAYGTSGTWRAVAELLRESDGGAVIQAASLEELYQTVASTGEVQGDQVGSLRKSVLPAGIAICKAIFDELKLDMLHVADATLKEGLIYDTIGRFSQQDTRNTTVGNLQQSYNIDCEQAQRVARMAITFWQQIGGPELPGVSRTKILNWAAQLHEIGLNISHSGHHQHGYYILRHSDLAGFGRYEQYILANLVQLHRRKLTKDKLSDLDESAIKAFLPLVVCLRLSVLLYRRREDLEIEPKLSRQESIYELTFPSQWLEKRPLTTASLEQEVSYLAKMDIQLKLK